MQKNSGPKAALIL